MSESSTQLPTVQRRTKARGIVARALGVSSTDRPVDPDRLIADHPDLMPELEMELAKLRAIENARQVASSETGGRSDWTNRHRPVGKPLVSPRTKRRSSRISNVLTERSPFTLYSAGAA